MQAAFQFPVGVRRWANPSGGLLGRIVHDLDESHLGTYHEPSNPSSFHFFCGLAAVLHVPCTIPSSLSLQSQQSRIATGERAPHGQSLNESFSSHSLFDAPPCAVCCRSTSPPWRIAMRGEGYSAMNGRWWMPTRADFMALPTFALFFTLLVSAMFHVH